jgi:hypothetical protein
MSLEFIACAAIKIPYNLFTGINHGVCFGKLKDAAQQGFLADQYSGSRFVDRYEALKIAKEAGQTINKHKPTNMLLSKDLSEDERFRG